MEIKVTMKQEIKNGELQPTKFDLSMTLLYGTGDIKWSKNAFLLDLDRETMEELIPKLQKEVEKALAYKTITPTPRGD